MEAVLNSYLNKEGPGNFFFYNMTYADQISLPDCLLIKCSVKLICFMPRHLMTS